MGVRLALMVRDQPFANFKEGPINRIHFSMNKNIFVLVCYFITLHVQAAALRAASRYFHRGLRQCFQNDYAFLFDSPVNGRIDNDTSGRSPTYILAAG